jgi:hypothetical protein
MNNGQKIQILFSHCPWSITVLHKDVFYRTSGTADVLLKGLSHEMDLAFVDMRAKSGLGLNRGRGQFFKFLCALMILQSKKCISRG